MIPSKRRLVVELSVYEGDMMKWRGCHVRLMHNN